MNQLLASNKKNKIAFVAVVSVLFAVIVALSVTVYEQSITLKSNAYTMKIFDDRQLDKVSSTDITTEVMPQRMINKLAGLTESQKSVAASIMQSDLGFSRTDGSTFTLYAVMVWNIIDSFDINENNIQSLLVNTQNKFVAKKVERTLLEIGTSLPNFVPQHGYGMKATNYQEVANNYVKWVTAWK